MIRGRDDVFAKTRAQWLVGFAQGSAPDSRVGSVSKFVREAGFVIGCLPVKVGHIR